MSQWLRDVVEYVYALERYTAGGGVNAICAFLLLAILTSGALMRAISAGYDRVMWAIERRREARFAWRHGDRWRAKPFPQTDARVKLGVVWVGFTLACLGMLAVISASD